MKVLLGVGVAVTAVGSWMLWRTIADYLGNPLTPLSTSGNRVFVLPDGTLGAFEPFALGYEPAVVGAGILLLVAAALVGAVVHRR